MEGFVFLSAFRRQRIFCEIRLHSQIVVNDQHTESPRIDTHWELFGTFSSDHFSNPCVSPDAKVHKMSWCYFKSKLKRAERSASLSLSLFLSHLCSLFPPSQFSFYPLLPLMSSFFFSLSIYYLLFLYLALCAVFIIFFFPLHPLHF